MNCVAEARADSGLELTTLSHCYIIWYVCTRC